MAPLSSSSVGKKALLVAGRPGASRARRQTGACKLSYQRESDSAELSAIVGLAAMRGAAEAVEAVRVGISVEVERLDLTDPRGDQPMDDIGFEVEVRLAGRPSTKKRALSGSASRNRARKPASTS